MTRQHLWETAKKGCGLLHIWCQAIRNVDPPFTRPHKILGNGKTHRIQIDMCIHCLHGKALEAVIILCMGSANERWCYNVTSSLRTHAQNDPCEYCFWLMLPLFSGMIVSVLGRPFITEINRWSTVLAIFGTKQKLEVPSVSLQPWTREQWVKWPL